MGVETLVSSYRIPIRPDLHLSLLSFLYHPFTILSVLLSWPLLSKHPSPLFSIRPHRSRITPLIF